MRLTQLNEKTGIELTSKGCEYLRLLTTVNRDNKQYYLYEPSDAEGNRDTTISEVLRCRSNNAELYICE